MKKILTNFKIVINIISNNPENLKRVLHVKFMLNFYSIQHLTLHGDHRVIIDFIVLENSAASSLGFPSKIQAVINRPAEEIDWLINEIFLFSRVVNEETFIKFLDN